MTNLPALGERTIWIDCDVIQADGGTRTASITGAFVALALALEKLRERDVIRTIPLTDYVAATSVGIVDGEPLLDLAYDDDSRADVDMNIVKTGDGRFIEVQGTAEAIPFGRDALLHAARSRRPRHQAAGREAARDRRPPGQDGSLTSRDRRRCSAHAISAQLSGSRRHVVSVMHALFAPSSRRRSATCWRSSSDDGLCALEFTRSRGAASG